MLFRSSEERFKQAFKAKHNIAQARYDAAYAKGDKDAMKQEAALMDAIYADYKTAKTSRMLKKKAKQLGSTFWLFLLVFPSHFGITC